MIENMYNYPANIGKMREIVKHVSNVDIQDTEITTQQLENARDELKRLLFSTEQADNQDQIEFKRYLFVRFNKQIYLKMVWEMYDRICERINNPNVPLLIECSGRCKYDENVYKNTYL